MTTGGVTKSKKSERVQKLLDAEKELATMLESLENDEAVGTGNADGEVDKAGKKKRKSKSKKSKKKKKRSKRSSD
jgi:hypothetical protein